MTGDPESVGIKDQAYGDKRILEEQYPSMKAWVEYMRRAAGNNYIWSSGFNFRDWLAFATTQSDYPGATTAKDFLQTAYFRAVNGIAGEDRGGAGQAGGGGRV